MGNNGENDLKLAEMKFQYQLIENNYSRLVNKCSLSMLGICIILGAVFNQKRAFEAPLLSVTLTSIFFTTLSLVILALILAGYRQPLIKHQQVIDNTSDNTILKEKLIGTYGNLLGTFKVDISKAHSRYKYSLICLIISIMLMCLSFYQ